MTVYTRQTYSGKCVGGPMDGQELAHDKMIYEIRELVEDSEPLSYRVTRYIWNFAHRQWDYHG